MIKNKIGTLQILVLLTVVATTVVPIVYALTTLWSTQVGVNVIDTVSLGVYADSACTIVVQSVDFGSLKKGAYANKFIYIKNTGTASITLDWSSNAPTTILAGDDWCYKSGTSWANIRQYVLKPNEVLETRYEIFILPAAPAGSKTWTLNLGSAV